MIELPGPVLNVVPWPETRAQRAKSARRRAASEARRKKRQKQRRKR